MLNRNMLKCELIIKGRTFAWVAKNLSMSKTTFYRKLRDGSFTIDQAQGICDLLDIVEPSKKCDIFFAHDIPKVGQ